MESVVSFVKSISGFFPAGLALSKNEDAGKKPSLRGGLDRPKIVRQPDEHVETPAMAR